MSIGSVRLETTKKTTMDSDKQREAEIQKLCADVLQMSADCYESGGGTSYTSCPLCHEEVRLHQGGMDDIKHNKDCGYLLAKGLSTGS